MTWPAPDLRIDYQNATVSADTHPGAHNETNLTLNDDYRPEILRLGNVVNDSYAAGDGTAVTGITAETTLAGVTRSPNLLGGEYLLNWWCPLRCRVAGVTVFDSVTVRLYRGGVLVAGTELALVTMSANERFIMTGAKLLSNVAAGNAQVTMTVQSSGALDTNTGGAASGTYGYSIQRLGASQ